jgi:diketogulonate reductase-like aldo/keto reductase
MTAQPHGETHTQTTTLNTGAQMPVLALGTSGLLEQACEDAVRWALELGYRHVDTAAKYGNEEAVGNGIRASGVPREDVFVTTKLVGHDHHGRVREAVEESVQRLGLGYVDCYLVHWPEGPGADLAVWQEMEPLHRAGILRAIGVSNYSAAQLAELTAAADVPPAVNQVEANPFARPRDVEDACLEHGVALQAYRPLAHGDRFGHAEVQAVARRHDRTEAQVMLRWGLQHGFTVLPRSGSRERIAANSSLFDFELSGSDMEILDALG